MTRLIRRLVFSLEDYDNWLLVSVFGLCLLGTVAVFGAASYRTEALARDGGNHYYLLRHVLRLGIGLVLMFLLARIDYRLLRHRYLNWTLFALGMVFVALPVLIGGVTRADCARWFSLFGLVPVQPLEFVKVALVFFLAERFARLDSARDNRYVGKILLAPLALIGILVLQPNYGNALVIALFTGVLFFLVGVSVRLLAVALAALGTAAVVGVLFVSKLNSRFFHWLEGLQGGTGNYQVDQSLIGLGAGGWVGQGLGSGQQRFWFLPESHTDFIYAAIGEELGLIGTLGALLLFIVLAWRGLAVARRAPDPFGRITAAGLTVLLFLYVLMNIGMVTGLLPVMGLPLPFLSYGGSALVTNLAAVGILLSIDRQGRAYETVRRRWNRI